MVNNYSRTQRPTTYESQVLQRHFESPEVHRAFRNLVIVYKILENRTDRIVSSPAFNTVYYY